MRFAFVLGVPISFTFSFLAFSSQTKSKMHITISFLNPKIETHPYKFRAHI